MPDLLFPNVMVIDDEAMTQDLIKHMLHEIRCGDIALFGSATKALQTVKKSKGYFHLVICDWEMPGMNGLEFLQSFRELEPDTPFLMVTGNTSKELVMSAIKAGVTDFLGKPFTAKDLLEKAKKLIKSRVIEEAKSPTGDS